MKLVALVGLCLGLLPAGARAEPGPALVVSLDDRAPGGCPDAASFRRQVSGRTARVQFADARAVAELSWTVVIQQAAGGTRGALSVSGGELGKLERKVDAESCDQVVTALALVAALSVDPEASLSAPPQPPPPALVEKPPPPAPPPEPRTRVRVSLGLALTVRSGLGQQLSWAPRPFVGISFRSAGGHTWGLGLSAMQVHGDAAAPVGQADFTWSLGRLEAFPVRWGGASLRFEPALFVEAGQVRAQGVAVTPAAEVRRPALLLGALGRLSVLAFDLLLVQLEGGPAFPVVRDRFYLQENTTVFRAPPVAGFAAVGVGLEFL